MVTIQYGNTFRSTLLLYSLRCLVQLQLLPRCQSQRGAQEQRHVERRDVALEVSG